MIMILYLVPGLIQLDWIDPKKKKKVYKGENHELIFFLCIFACVVKILFNSCTSHGIISIKSDRGPELSKILYPHSFCENRQPSKVSEIQPCDPM